jgi:nitroreductase
VPDLFDVVGSQRACRSFRPDPVDDALVARVLEAATFAPSAENRQPWVFVVVRDAGTRQAIGRLNEQAWENGARVYSEGRLAPGLLADVTKGVRGGVSGAPVIIAVCGDRDLVPGQALASSIFPAVQNLLLAATAVGLGSALTTLPTVVGDELAQLLDLPGHIRPLAVVPLGWPERALGRPRRQPVGTKSHLDRYGKPWEARP